MSGRTIHEWVETGHLDPDLSSAGTRYSPRPSVTHKLAPYTGIIDAYLAEVAIRVFDGGRTAGYPDGYGRVPNYARALRPHWNGN